MTLEEMIAQVQASKHYRDVCPDTVARICRQEWPKYRKVQDAEKSVKTKLHQITGMFLRGMPVMPDGDDPTSWLSALSLHASTQERMGSYAALYGDIESVTGPLTHVLDIACGLNPVLCALYARSRGGALPQIRGCDIQMGAVSWVNEALGRLGVVGDIEAADVLVRCPLDAAQVALVFKLLPLLEQQGKGAALALLEALRTDYVAVTFPTRTLGGRSIGMAEHYRRAYGPVFVQAGYTVALERDYANELLFVLRRP